MKRVLGIFARSLIRSSLQFLTWVHPGLPSAIETQLKHLDGRGSGGGSVKLEVRLALEILGRLGISSPVVFDVGANVGSYSEEFLRKKPSSRIFAFEPSSKARNELEGKFLGILNVTVIPNALGSRVENLLLWSDKPGSGSASLTRRRLEHFGIDFNYSEEVSVITLDSWIESNQVFPDLIKLDVEGHELDVLLNGLKAIDTARVIQFEFGGCNIDTRTYFQDFWYFFKDHNFQIFRITERGAKLLTNYSEEYEYFRTTNFIAVRDFPSEGTNPKVQ